MAKENACAYRTSSKCQTEMNLISETQRYLVINFVIKQRKFSISNTSNKFMDVNIS